MHTISWKELLVLVKFDIKDSILSQKFFGSFLTQKICKICFCRSTLKVQHYNRTFCNTYGKNDAFKMSFTNSLNLIPEILLPGHIDDGRQHF